MNMRTLTDPQESHERLDLVLRVLDHQVVGPEGELLGKIDDVELTPHEGALAVTGFAVGPGALSQRLPGRLGRWVGAAWRRLSTTSEPRPVVVPASHLTSLGPSIELDATAAQALADSFGFERWLRTFVVSRIPGAKGGGEADREARDDAPRVLSPQDPTDPPTRPPMPRTSWLSVLLASSVVDEAGRRLGDIIELRCDPASEPWLVTHVHCTQSILGTELGYHADPRQGPAVLRRIFRRLQRLDLLIPVGEVTAIHQDQRRVVVTQRDHRRHPHRNRGT